MRVARLICPLTVGHRSLLVFHPAFETSGFCVICLRRILTFRTDYVK